MIPQFATADLVGRPISKRQLLLPDGSVFIDEPGYLLENGRSYRFYYYSDQSSVCQLFGHDSFVFQGWRFDYSKSDPNLVEVSRDRRVEWYLGDKNKYAQTQFYCYSSAKPFASKDYEKVSDLGGGEFKIGEPRYNNFGIRIDSDPVGVSLHFGFSNAVAGTLYQHNDPTYHHRPHIAADGKVDFWEMQTDIASIQCIK